MWHPLWLRSTPFTIRGDVVSDEKEDKKTSTPIFVSKASKIHPVQGNCPVDGSKLEVAVGRAPMAPPEQKGDRYHSCGKCNYFYVEAVA